MGRRQLFVGTAALIAASSLASGVANAATDAAAPEVSFDDGLAVPMPAPAPFGRGKDRALVLGGGGEYFAAWMLGFVHGLQQHGVTYQMPDIIVGTSAGSFVGSTMAGGHLVRLTKEFDFFGRVPKLLSTLVPTPTPNPSQLRAHDLCQSAKDASLATIQGIGRGAMAARNPDVAGLQKMIRLLTGNRAWPSDRFHAVTMDCYTGQRLVISSTSKVPVPHAVSASMSLPGIFGPTWVHDRICMDGGMSASSTHSDLVAGAKRALVVSLTDGTSGSGPRFSTIPNDLQQELKDLEASGTKVMLIAANPGKVNLVSPEEIAPAMKAGFGHAVAQVDRIKAFWA